MTKLEEIKRCRLSAIEIEEYFQKLIDIDKEMLYLQEDWESSYWKFLVQAKTVHNYIERNYEVERNKKCRAKNSKLEKTDK